VKVPPVLKNHGWTADVVYADDEEKAPPLWLRICRMIEGAISSAIEMLLLGILSAILGVLRGVNLPLIIASMPVVGACVGLALPRQTLGALFAALVE
jgi:hypothetical protein